MGGTGPNGVKTIFDDGQEYQARKILLALGQQRFGKPTPEILVAVNALDDLDRFARMTLRILDVSSWTELLETP